MTEPTALDPNRRLDAAIRARDLEIDLFWKRSVFFWGFIAAAFLAFVNAAATRPFVGFVISGFGVICSLIWTLANRGSKYWFESWEQKVQEAERPVIGVLFGAPEPAQRQGEWLSGRRFSVSRLAVALSDYTLSLWLILFVTQGARAAGVGGPGTDLIKAAVVLFGVYTVGFAIATFRKTGPRSPVRGKTPDV